jgi:hypothetical protein
MATEPGIESRQPVTITVSSSGLRKIDEARGLINRSAFFELAGTLLADLLKQDQRVAAAVLKIPREALRARMASALLEGARP